ncbi:Protein phosphatase 2C and cyclic nucleotide-binding/kinase domain-containing protein [Includes: Probable protein phosphatase 2C 19 (AtPP2C19) [Durusdinium trenchii]|uniref:Protein phosphatase 2C and cyclic nucleotide-binding/kinase domain-containing protein n=1 Tax=Durusdinium trenchii TaxID=1381693 RepID=A0ABP0J8F9_9DINO
MASFVLREGTRVCVAQGQQKEGQTDIQFEQAKLTGTVRYFGTTEFKAGNWVGLELDSQLGKHDGTIDGKAYFKCQPGHGLFVRPNLVTLADADKEGMDVEKPLSGDAERMDLEEHKIADAATAPSSQSQFWFELPARAFIFNKSNQQWIELGSGPVKLSWEGAPGKIGVKLVDSTNARRCIDHLAEPSVKVDETVVSGQSWVFRACRAVDPSIKDVLCLQFASVPLATSFHNEFLTRRGELDPSVTAPKGRKKKNDKNGAGKTRVMRRRLTVSGSDPRLDGHKKGARMDPNSPKPTSPKKLKGGEVGRWSSAGSQASSSPRINVLAYSGVSRKGLAPYNPDKQNQDSMILEQLPFNGYCNGELLLGVFDGHGENGHHVSRYITSRLTKLLASNPKFSQDEHTGSVLADSMLTIENELIQERSIDTTLSGSTAVWSVLRNNKLFVANIGDSRICKATTKTDKNTGATMVVAEDLSEDHKPELPKEKERILKVGGRVFAMTYDDGIDGPNRVWLSYADMPGLAMSRSVCDTIAKEAGVISQAELFEHELVPGRDKALVLATDGLWEFMSSEEVVQIVQKHDEDPRSAISELVRESNKRWQQEEPVIDDTTIIVAYLG